MTWLYLLAFYGWLGFTAGYFYRKWLERRWVPGFQGAETEDTSMQNNSVHNDPAARLDASTAETGLGNTGAPQRQDP